MFLERIIICSWRCHLRAGLGTRQSPWRSHLTRSPVATRTIITGTTRLALPFETWLLQALFFIKPGMHPTRVVLWRKGQLCPAKLKAPWWGLLQVMMMTDPKLELLYICTTLIPAKIKQNWHLSCKQPSPASGFRTLASWANLFHWIEKLAKISDSDSVQIAPQ